MAAPSIRGFTAPVITTGAIDQPAATQVGDLVIFGVWSQNTTIPTHTKNADASYVEIRSQDHNDGTTDGRLSLAYRVATAAGVASHTPYTVTNAAANQTCAGVLVLTKGTYDIVTAVKQNGTTSTATSVPNPASVTAMTGDWLVGVFLCWHVTTAGSTATTPGTNYTEQTEGPAGSHVTHLVIATRSLTGLNNSTEDPPAWNDNVTPNGTATVTFAIKGSVPRTGTGATSSAAQTAAGAGEPLVAGSGATAASAQVSAGEGVVEDTGIDGVGATSASAQVSAAAGAIVITGSAASSSTVQTTASTGAVAIVGGASATSASSQTTAASGSPIPAGAGATASAAQTSVSAGSVPLAGVAATSALAQASAASGTQAITGSAATSASSQTTAAAGTVAIAGSAGTAASAQTTTASGAVSIAGAGATTAAAQVTAAIGSTMGATFGAGATSAAPQTTAASGSVSAAGAMTTTASAQVSAANGAVGITGSAGSVSSSQTSTAPGFVVIVGTMATVAPSQIAFGFSLDIPQYESVSIAVATSPRSRSTDVGSSIVSSPSVHVVITEEN